MDAHCAVKLFWHSAVVGLPIPSLISDPKFYFRLLLDKDVWPTPLCVEDA